MTQTDILQRSLPFAPWADPALSRLPGMRPVVGDVIQVDEVYGPQIALKAHLLATRRAQVLAQLPGSEAAVAELLAWVLDHLPAGFAREGAAVRCPDGRRVVPEAGGPLDTLAQLIQEDVVILAPGQGGYVMTAALLCFPASWTLAEKIGKPLGPIHGPVAAYDPEMARRVDRLFAHVHPDRPMWRANALRYHDPCLFQPRSEVAPRIAPKGPPAYLRSERQTVLALPETGARAFLIHTYVLRFADLPPADRHIILTQGG